LWTAAFGCFLAGSLSGVECKATAFIVIGQPRLRPVSAAAAFYFLLRLSICALMTSTRPASYLMAPLDV
jgi:hypothetical protein